MEYLNRFDDLAKAVARGMTRRAALLRVAQVFGGIVVGTFTLRSSFLHGADTKGANLTQTLKDKSFKCTSVKAALRVEGEYNVCLHRVRCNSARRGVPPRYYMPTCKAVNGKCPRFKVCGNPDQQRDQPVIHEEAGLAEVGPDDRRPTDKYGRKCHYHTATPIAVFLNAAEGVIAFCATPLICTQGDADAPNLAFAVCEPNGVVEDGVDRPTLICPRVNACINTPIKSSRAEMIEADK